MFLRHQLCYGFLIPDVIHLIMIYPMKLFEENEKKNHYLTIWLSDVLQGMIKTLYAVIQ